MKKKLSLEEFNNIKKKIEKWDYYWYGEDYLISSLFENDLSDIPFEAWEDFDFDYADDINFSHSRPNIDFRYFKYNGRGKFH